MDNYVIISLCYKCLSLKCLNLERGFLDMRNDVVVKDDAVETAKSAIVAICIIVGVVTLIAGIAVAVYKYLTRDYLDDFDEFDDDFDDDFFEDDADFTDDVAPAEA